MHGFDNVVRRRFRGFCQHQFRNQIRGFIAENVRAEQLAIFFLENQFHKTFGLANGDGFTQRPKGKTTNGNVEAFLLRLRLRQTNARHLRLAICAARNRIITHRRWMFARNRFDASDAFCGRHMCQQRRADHISDGVNARDIRAIELIVFNKGTIHRNANFLKAQVITVAGKTNRHQRHVAGDFFFACFR